MRKLTGAVVAGAVVLGTPVAGIAVRMHVDHGAGPSVVHDAAYDGVVTQVHAWSRSGSTRVRLMVDGLPAGQQFGAHVHTKPCGALPGDSGGHYQHSTDTSVPLAEREIWLDVTAGVDGHASTTTQVPWEIAPGTAGSVVLHALPTDPVTGAAGARLACTTVTFGE